ncbi:sterile alpha motif/pointed domain-containing protein [Polychytrium aggregatum]|uniref:sterile alpha motif/pointed domain-containing protein n=1 Tax=Polychytrium aggregatum TaxID=110093 RepID=UPI0022FF330E|nr:sterile alpha motif/pointed domain-containing protein [Polychytrium aggregatum]KAI9197051.1 sterile alpha motif/pointed domain-containing protein [Polychytrium aggregatum]
MDISRWSTDQVAEWLVQNNFASFRDSFVSHNVGGMALLQLDYELLKEIGVLKVGERARILRAIKLTSRRSLAGHEVCRPNSIL